MLSRIVSGSAPHHIVGCPRQHPHVLPLDPATATQEVPEQPQPLPTMEFRIQSLFLFIQSGSWGPGLTKDPPALSCGSFTLPDTCSDNRDCRPGFMHQFQSSSTFQISCSGNLPSTQTHLVLGPALLFPIHPKA